MHPEVLQYTLQTQSLFSETHRHSHTQRHKHIRNKHRMCIQYILAQGNAANMCKPLMSVSQYPISVRCIAFTLTLGGTYSWIFRNGRNNGCTFVGAGMLFRGFSITELVTVTFKGVQLSLDVHTVGTHDSSSNKKATTHASTHFFRFFLSFAIHLYFLHWTMIYSCVYNCVFIHASSNGLVSGIQHWFL